MMDNKSFFPKAACMENYKTLSETESVSENLTLSVEGDNEDDRTLDCRGLSCPMPIIKTKKTLASMNAGEILRIETTCKNSKSNMHAFTTKTENELLEIKEENNAFIFYIRKK